MGLCTHLFEAIEKLGVSIEKSLFLVLGSGGMTPWHLACVVAQVKSLVLCTAVPY